MFDRLRPAGGRPGLMLAMGIALTTLSACGGGGGNDKPLPGSGMPSNAQSITVSGSLTLVETAAVDSDTNDGKQANRQDNGDFDVAQPLVTPVNLVGTVNEAGAGEEGPNKFKGDDVDGYVVELQADQTVELEFAADPGVNDLDLLVWDAKQQEVGESIGFTNTECMRISTPGKYYIGVISQSGASVYNLRIGSPGSSRACANATGAPIPLNELSQLVALPRTRALAAGTARANTGSSTATLMRQAGLRMDAAASGVPTLIQLPTDATARAQGLRTLRQGLGAPAASAPAASTTVAERWAQRWPQAAQALQRTAYAKQLLRSGQFAYVQPDHRQLQHALVGPFPPNDPSYADQRWHYEQINLPAAMERLVALPTQPDRRPLVAVIDSGIMVDHDDLSTQILEGRTFLSHNTAGDGNSANPNDPTPRPDPSEPGYHGTHVAGTIAARTFDQFGAAGVAPMALLMPLRVFDPTRRGASTYDIVQAMRYAAGLSNNSGSTPSRRADVINMSLGASASCEAAFQDAITQVRRAGVIVVISAGNDAQNNLGKTVPVGSPANCSGAVSVGALDIQRHQTSYSQSGPELALAAPGGDVTLTSTGTAKADLITSTMAAFTTSGVRVPGVGMKAGTSMAAPHVAGVIALMKYVNPGFTPDDFDAWLRSGVLTDDVGTAGRDNATGMGLINARKAVDKALSASGNGSTPAPKGEVIASPYALDFGGGRDTMPLSLMTTASTDEVVQSIQVSAPNMISVQASLVDPVTRLGQYVVKVLSRDGIPSGATAFPTITVKTSLRTLTVQLTVVRGDGGSAGGRRPDFGHIYVLAIDAQTDEPIRSDAATQGVSAVNGVYDWQFTGTLGQRVYLVAGADLDNNGYICDSGEPCGAFPLSGATLSAITLTSGMGRISFPVAPVGTGNVTANALDARGSHPLGPIKWR
jgi:serine protease